MEYLGCFIAIAFVVLLVGAFLLRRRVGHSTAEFFKNDNGHDLVEYALMVGLVTVAVVAIVPIVSATIRAIFLTIVAILSKTPETTIVLSTNDIATAWIRVVAAILALVLLGLIIRHRSTHS